MRAALATVIAVGALALPLPAAWAQAPANDAFASAEQLSGSEATARGNNEEATSEAGEPSHGGSAAGKSVWYRWTAPATATMIVSLCDSDFDTVLAVYTGQSVEALMRVASNDDSDSCDELQSRLTFEATAGVTYSIAVDGAGADSGEVRLSLAPKPPPPKPEPGPYSGSTDFGERISFSLNRRRTRVTRLVVSYQMNCTRGFTESRTVIRSIRVRNDRFQITARFRFRGGARQTVRISGRFQAPRRAIGTVRSSGSFPGVGRCRTPFGSIPWSARHRG